MIKTLIKAEIYENKALTTINRNNKYLMKNNRPYQHYINQGLFKLKNIGYKTNCIGEQTPLFKTYITKKGLGRFLNKFVNDGYINFTNDTKNN